MNTYTVTVKPDSNAFAAIQRFDPEVLIELEDSDEAAETYAITSDFVLDVLLDAAPGLVEWDDAPAKSLSDYVCDFPPDDPEPPDAPAKFQDWDCWQHPSTGWHETKRTPKTIDKISDFALTKLIDDPATAAVAAAEWRRRYPQGEASRTGTKSWARGYDAKASAL